MPSNDDLTPVRQQYLEIKREHPDRIVFFRLGDFYETFDEDAEITARELDIVLTSRPVGGGVRVPLAGIPYHAVENYLARLIEKGYHVAICEQVGEQPVKGIFPRKVVRVVTPGTVTEPGLLPGDANNYLASVILDTTTAVNSNPITASVSYVDITTGEFAVTELPLEALRAELTRLHPAEIIHPDSQVLPDGITGHITALPAWKFEPGKCSEVLISHFKASTLAGFGLKDNSLSARAAGAIVQYLKETQPDALNLLTSLRAYSLNEFMTLDASTRRNLELDETLRGDPANPTRGMRKGSLLGTLDFSVTPMGKRLMHQWVSQPLLHVAKITQRQNGVQYFVENGMVRAELRATLKPLADLERLVNRVLAGQAQPRDLVAMRTTLTELPKIKEVISGQKAVVSDQWSVCTQELSLLQNAIDDDPPATLQNTGVIRPGYSSELDGVIDASKHARDWIANLEGVEREKTGIKTLKVGYNKVFGYYIEISRGAADKAPESYIRKQTLVNAERFITPEMKEYETLVLNAEERIKEIETRLFREVCAELVKAANQILATARAIAELDVLSALGEAAALGGYTRPEVHEGSGLEIHEGRHPVVEQLLKSDRYIPNDVIFEKGEVVRVITGPNMSGKSTYLRQTALIVLMAQMGSFVPAASAKIGLVDRIFTRIGAQDEIHAGQSTFMVEMVEAANILHHATPRSLLILDEIGRGTSTYDGLSIAWGIIEYIHNHPQLRAKTLFATHYHELTQLADLLPGIRNYNVAVSEADNKVVFLHKIIAGGADRSYGIHVGQLAGLPAPVIQRATEIMAELEKTSGRAVKIDPNAAQQVALFPETNPLLDELKELDVNSLSPIEALNKLFEWRMRFTK
ncbi:MAG TPA: DNA mismatch repair protein MutS, partial [Anaerolineales bacterium]|nr:DNA mismatch repair protein MutS [Anaerolineales bacterium]HNC88451.1 DNA mismatch repair protein MutS [Anaerolineales bacterium]HND91639.1 DNA mismatch repair protein MutS [Anaerolineales bacterium]HNH04799.1 DNA mismatch repair protein MutS [Anaerolineales bacterium]